MSDKEKITEILKSAKKQNRRELTEYESKQVLSAWEISTTRVGLARNVLEAVRAARKLKYPVVLKIASPDILHKTDANGVRVGLSSELEVRQSFRQITSNAKAYKEDADIWGVTVQEYLPPAREVIIGLIQDETFGPTLMFGLGGVWVEALKDVSFRLAPVSDEDAREMIREIGGYPVLKGARGEPPADVDALVVMLQKVGKLVSEFDEISEMDLNPVFVFERGKGAMVVDARIILEESEEEN
jgi:acyl-CoA synthetase (NDP forming)